MQDPTTSPTRDPAYNSRVGNEPVREKGNNGIFFILGAIVVALGVIFFLVSGGDDADTVAPAENGTVIENNAPAADTTAPATTAPAETAPTPAPEAPAVDPAAPDAAAPDATAPAPAPAN